MNQPNQHTINRILFTFCWVSFSLLGAILFQQWERSTNPNTTTAPPNHHQYRAGIKEVTLNSNSYGHYVSNGFINDHKVLFLLDTGSTQVAIPGDVADKMGLTYGKKQATGTANGTIWVYSTKLEHLKIGNIELKNVDASINPHMEEAEILLGMSVLKQLDFYQRGGTLKLQQVL